MNLADQPAKSCTEPSKLGARPPAAQDPDADIRSLAIFLAACGFARAMLVGSAEWRMFATPQSRPRY
jgi:hypothetical protein